MPEIDRVCMLSADRALTRAHMMALVVNEQIRDGWLEYLRHVRYDPKKAFNAKEEEGLVDAGYYHRPDQVVLEQLLAKSPPLAREIDDAAILLVRNPRFYLDVLGTSKKTFRAHLKTGELNPDGVAVGKRTFKALG